MQALFKILLAWTLLVIVCSDSSEKRLNDLLVNYEKDQSPSVAAGPGVRPTEVKIGIYVMHFHFIERDDFEIMIYLRQSWRDERLKFSGQPIKVTESKLIWKPDTFLRSSLDMKSFDVPVDQSFIRVKENGDVWYVKRLLIKGFCSSEDASNFPMDKRSCSLIFESFSNTMDQFYFGWLASPVEIDESLRTTDGVDDWTLQDHVLNDCSQNYTSGNYSCLEVKFVLNREIGSYKLSVFVPSSILTILALLPLLIGSKQSLISKLLPALTAQLGLIMISTEAYKNAPVKSTATRMHVWFLFHYFYFLIILIVALLLDKLIRQPKQTEPEPEKTRAGGGRLDGVKSKLNQFGWIIDLILVIVFVVIYVLFRISFWASAPPA